MPDTDTPPTTSRFVVLASTSLVLAALYFAQEVFVPLALGILFSFLLSPVVIRLERMHLPRVVSVLTVVLVALALVVLLGWTVSNQAVDLAYSLPKYQDRIAQKLSHLPLLRSGRMNALEKTVTELRKSVEAPTSQPTTNPISASQPAGPSITQSIASPSSFTGSLAQMFADALRSGPPLPVAVQQETPAGLGMLRNLFTTAAAPLGTAFIVIVFVIFMLLRREDLRDRVIRLVGQGQLDVTTQAINDAGARISRYLLMQSLINTIYGLIVGFGLWIIGRTAHAETGYPNAALWGLLCGLLRFVPYVGPWLGAICPLLLSFAVFPGIAQFGYTVALFVSIELLNNSVLEPVMYGSSTGLSALAILAAAVFWTWLWGPIGLLLSTPLTVCLVVIGKYVPALQFLDIILGDEPVLSPPTRLYQRLLALDPDEASRVMDEYRKTMSLEELYDSVALPALAMGEQDSHRGKLDEKRHLAVRQSLRDLVEELGDREMARVAERVAKGDEGKAGEPRPRLPQDCSVNVMLLPARDDADETVGIMLGQLLTLRGYCVIPISTNALANEMVEHVGQQQADLVVVSALPPDAVAHARYLSKKLNAQLPAVPMVVGLWTMQDELPRARERIAGAPSARFAASLKVALEEIHQLAQPKIAGVTPQAGAEL